MLLSDVDIPNFLNYFNFSAAFEFLKGRPLYMLHQQFVGSDRYDFVHIVSKFTTMRISMMQKCTWGRTL